MVARAILGCSQNIITNDQKGGSNVINAGPRYGQISQETITQIKKEIPPGATVTLTKALQDGPTAQVAQQLLGTLVSLGYKFEPQLVSDSIGHPYFKGIRVYIDNGKYTVMVGDTRLD